MWWNACFWRCVHACVCIWKALGVCVVVSVVLGGFAWHLVVQSVKELCIIKHRRSAVQWRTGDGYLLFFLLNSYDESFVSLRNWLCVSHPADVVFCCIFFVGWKDATGKAMSSLKTSCKILRIGNLYFHQASCFLLLIFNCTTETFREELSFFFWNGRQQIYQTCTDVRGIKRHCAKEDSSKKGKTTTKGI